MLEYVNLLLFSVQQVSFGVYAEQIEELLEARGVPAREQESANAADVMPYKGRNIRVIHFSQWLAQEQPNRSPCVLHSLCDVAYHHDENDAGPALAPKILIIKHHQEGYIGVRIEHPEDLITVSVKQIQALPTLIQKTKTIQGLWGIALVNERPIILIDLTQLLRDTKSKEKDYHE